MANYIKLQTTNYSFLDRITLQNEQRDVYTIIDRFHQLKLSSDIGKAYLFGVGLGNYYDNLPASEKNKNYPLDRKKLRHIGAKEYIHNIFGSITAESGLISLFIFLIIVFLFIKQDIIIIKKGSLYQKVLVVSFWSLFTHGMLNPPVPGAYQVLFWGLRGSLM